MVAVDGVSFFMAVATYITIDLSVNPPVNPARQILVLFANFIVLMKVVLIRLDKSAVAL